MKSVRICACIASLALVASIAGSLHAQTEDVFAFIPAGGKTLLIQAVQGAPAEEVRTLLAGKRSREEWLGYLQNRSAAIPAVRSLETYELTTLVDYLAFNMPLPPGKAPADPNKANWQKLLPPDGRDFTLEHCQFCHIITVVATQDKARDAWLGTLNKPSHVEIELTAGQREALANYLVVNGAIPVDLVPEELRAGGASY